MNRIFLQIHMFRLINLCVLRDVYHELVCVFKILCIRDAGPRGTAVTKSLHWPWQDGTRNELNTHQELYLKENAHLRHLKTPLTYTVHLPLCLSLSEKWRMNECLTTFSMESLQLAGNLLAVRCFRGVYLQKQRKLQCRPELSEQCRRKTDVMDASARMRACIRANVSGRKRFFFSYSLRQCFAVHCWKKTNKQTNSWVWRSLIVAHSKELFMTNFRRN